MVKIENLVKHYGSVRAVQGINFEVKDGEILGFLGANGAGKSTTLKVMTGFLSPTAGNVHFDDKNILEHSLEIRKEVGYLPENNPLYLEMKVYDFLEFIAKVRGIEGKAFKSALGRVIEQCGLKGIIHKQIIECSKGYKQRVGLAMAMIHDPKVLILDEPVSGLDPNQIVEIRELIKKVGEEKTVIISSHILQEIEATVDRIIIIHEGQLVADGTHQELMHNFHGKAQLTIEAKNATDDSIMQLKEKESGIHIANVSTIKDKRVISLEFDKKIDPREMVFNHAVAEKWTLLEMTTHKVQLEDVFRTLTIEGGGNA
ncbi:MAG: ATP-binding cassette domain-containing protein [Candidatus Marinimicrobia bacterium]|nr:ATP-binding cassette domain-containing protein [Candidatus Neomarinimicrobiota bacterium]MBL7108998.1 ATP-binding cassette domain-containing protein [Candidatus Neomarinimicrobiota bacterium]